MPCPCPGADSRVGRSSPVSPGLLPVRGKCGTLTHSVTQFHFLYVLGQLVLRNTYIG
ncbi:hypothetical protein NEUTE1DRAFT_115598 [Neurospora tetrasperma FGSC 2508]|uniref:Uncharacterized protein n=1 Tax=Neurospora tetrasperma (strain FGSC 2508 / ATCC MYA-4615 / P0657) TaxID=510951 RepID=F8MEZ6_NEUT8|nr:uncharacterized protein NEUTE1DRAFT_115598 [Neurospora tetrasperma FGSC 2508]EGO60048.1 hypothetical protein NEUTE1DRAFT_115598 [Neurospora tetrasperma FGSC 2508]EGZ76003.1 hypothetical protein NEUTE2DRAFT_143886 [Neurospora tetrasperma FGSC 2509]